MHPRAAGTRRRPSLVPPRPAKRGEGRQLCPVPLAPAKRGRGPGRGGRLRGHPPRDPRVPRPREARRIRHSSGSDVRSRAPRARPGRAAGERTAHSTRAAFEASPRDRSAPARSACDRGDRGRGATEPLLLTGSSPLPRVRGAKVRGAFVGEDGHRCESRLQLELDHVTPVKLGGKATVQGLRLRCRPHNVRAAERVFGQGYMARFRRSTRMSESTLAGGSAPLVK